MAKKDVFAGDKRSDREIEPLDLDSLSGKKSKDLDLHVERGDFLTGSDTIDDFLELNRIKTVSGEGSFTIQVPSRVFQKLGGEGSKFEQLQSFIIERGAKIMMGRIFNDLKASLSRSDWHPGERDIKFYGYGQDEAVKILRDTYWLALSDIETKADVRLDELEERASFLESENVVLRAKVSGIDRAVSRVNTLSVENKSLILENEALKASLSDKVRILEERNSLSQRVSSLEAELANLRQKKGFLRFH